MKLRQLTAPEIYRSGIDVNERNGFKMLASAKAYKVLSSTIYKYKIRAIIRETSTNAIDGHMVIGNMNSFDVHLPTVVEPFYSIRDYGIGLSDSDVQDKATVYFLSDKTESNDAIGSLGLGFKSPFSYSDTFTIVSWFDGVKRTYVAYMENGEPFVSLIEEIASNEPTGVEIVVPAKQEDIKEWETEAARVYESFMTIRPNFVGVQLEINYQPKESDRDDGLIVHQTKYHKGVYARMAGIMYPIDRELYKNTLLDLYTSNERAYIFEFANGDLDFMPSREELSLDKITKKAIMKRIKGVNGQYHINLLNAYSKFKTIREKVEFYLRKTNLKTYLDSKSDFHINGEPISNFVPRETNTSVIEEFELNGFWANIHGDSRRCEYKVLRYRQFETQSRISITKLISPQQQIKLYVVDMDVTAYKSVLAGYCILNKIDSIKFINKPYYEEQKQKFDAFVKYCHYEEDDIVYLKASEMIEEVKAYEKKFPKTSRAKQPREYDPRPKAPNAFMFKLVDGLVKKEDLYLTKKEFLKLPPTFGIRYYGISDYYPLNQDNYLFNLGELSTVNNGVMRSMMQKTGIHSVIHIRNSLWKWIPESNISCLQDELFRLYKNASAKLKPNGYSCIGNGFKYTRSLYNTFGITLDRLVKNRYDETNFSMLKFLTGYVSGQYFCDEDGVSNKVFYKMVQKYLVNREEMNTRVVEAFEKFKELNPLLYGVIYSLVDGNWSCTSEIRSEIAKEDFAKLIRWK